MGERCGREHERAGALDSKPMDDVRSPEALGKASGANQRPELRAGVMVPLLGHRRRISSGEVVDTALSLCLSAGRGLCALIHARRTWRANLNLESCTATENQNTSVQ